MGKPVSRGQVSRTREDRDSLIFCLNKSGMNQISVSATHFLFDENAGVVHTKGLVPALSPGETFEFHLYPLVWMCWPTNACPVRPGVNLKSFLF